MTAPSIRNLFRIPYMTAFGYPENDPTASSGPVSGCWIWSGWDHSMRYDAAFFRRAFDLDSKPEALRIRISADSRYRLHVNGQRIGWGPLKPTWQRWFYDVHDLAPWLVPGRNVIAVEVHHFGIKGPTSFVTRHAPGLFVQVVDQPELGSSAEWRCLRGDAIAPDFETTLSNARNFIGATEIVDLARMPHGWQSADFDDSGWVAATEIHPAFHRGYGCRDSIWPLEPRPIPHLDEEPCGYARSWQAGGDSLDLTETPFVRLPAGAERTVVLDAGRLVTGFPQIRFQGGRGGHIRILYSEGVFQVGDGTRERPRGKGRRDDPDDGVLLGYEDRLETDGRAWNYEPHHWRTFWYIQLTLVAGQSDLVLEGVDYRLVSFPFRPTAQFSTPDGRHERIFETSWHTLRLCSHETFEDCPYYEQLNYLQDTRNESLTSYVLTGDPRLARHSITMFRESVRHDGLVGSREPSRSRQQIPIFALWWVRMLREHWEYFGEGSRSFIEDNLYVMEGILRWFRRRMRRDGLFEVLPDWNPIGGEGARGTILQQTLEETGGSAYGGCLYAQALRSAITLYEAMGQPEHAEPWRPVLTRVRQAVLTECWDPGRRLLREAPGEDGLPVSQHTQVEAILAGIVTGKDARALAAGLMDADRFVPMTRQHGLSLAEALFETGQERDFQAGCVAQFEEMLDRGLSTWVEGSLDRGRSDCHAWSAWMPVAYFTRILGIRPASPGFETIRIEPNFLLSAVSGTMPTPVGDVSVAWKPAGGDGAVNLQVSVPRGRAATLVLPAGETIEMPEGGSTAVEVTRSPDA